MFNHWAWINLDPLCLEHLFSLYMAISQIFYKIIKQKKKGMANIFLKSCPDKTHKKKSNTNPHPPPKKYINQTMKKQKNNKTKTQITNMK